MFFAGVVLGKKNKIHFLTLFMKSTSEQFSLACTTAESGAVHVGHTAVLVAVVVVDDLQPSTLTQNKLPSCQ